MKTLYTIGIDFGTSNSCVCYASYNLRADGNVDACPVKRPEALSLQHADTIPTVVFLGDDAGQPALFGEIAEERAAFYPDLTRAGFKLKLGEQSAGGAEAFTLTRQFLSYLKEKVSEYVPLSQTGEDIQVETYVGHPVQWTADQREETLRAAREAGFPNVRLEGESMAAVYCHLCETGSAVLKRAGARVMMVDMGGGTTDFAFLELSEDPKQPPISHPVDPALMAEPWGDGRRSYGGRDLDTLLLNHFLKSWGYEEPPAELPVLMREMRRFKERFSTNLTEGIDVYQSMWLVGGQQRRVHMTREEFQQLTADYRSYFSRLMECALKQAGVDASEVSAIILTGGHSRWYFVEDALRERFPHIKKEDFTLLRHNHPEQSVARGLCYQRMVMAMSGDAQVARRKATHSIWVDIASQPGALETTVVANNAAGQPEFVNHEPVLVMPDGQLLPYRPTKPVTLAVQRLSLDGDVPTLRLRLYSGIQTGARMALAERTARFPRGLLEGMVKRFTRAMPWISGTDEDRFLVDIFCLVDENEMISGKVVITRLWRDKVMAVQTQPLRLDPSREMEPEKDMPRGARLALASA